jgi:hypothetical protein
MIRGTNYRHIPYSARIAILFGGFKPQFGWMFLAFGMVFFWAFAMNADLSGYYFDEEIEVVEGISLGANATNASENEIPVYATDYSFRTDDGIEYHGVSYATGEWVEAGQTLRVEFPKGNPEISRIQGMRMKIFSPFVLFVVIFPGVGLVFILLGLRRSFRALRLLRNGVMTYGLLVSKKRTNVKINGRTVYKISFKYFDRQGGEYIYKLRTPVPYPLMDEDKEGLLYLRNKPSCAIMVDSLPAAAKLNDKGELEPVPVLRALFLMLAPLGTTIGHGIYYINNYLG